MVSSWTAPSARSSPGTPARRSGVPSRPCARSASRRASSARSHSGTAAQATDVRASLGPASGPEDAQTAEGGAPTPDGPQTPDRILQPMDDRYDVIVVGARCAGAPTAMLLARAGHRVLLV